MFLGLGLSLTAPCSRPAQIPPWAAFKAIATQVVYASNAASNGYGLGNDTTGDGSRATPYATAGKASTVAADGAAIEVNPSGIPYAESLRPSSSKAWFIGCDTSVGAGEIVFQAATAVAQAVILDASVKRRVFYGAVFDGTGTTSGRGIAGNVTGAVEYYKGGFRNCTGFGHVTPTGTGSDLQFYGVNVESTVHFFMSGTGGNYANWKAWYCTFAQDNQVLTGSSSGVFTTVSVRYSTFTGHVSGTGFGLNFNGDTVGTIDFSDNYGSGTFAKALLQISASTSVSGLVQVKRNTGSPSAGTYLCNAEGVVQQEVDDNVLSVLAAHTQDQITVRAASGTAKARRNRISVAATAQTHGLALGGDGYNLNVTNTGATATVNFGDTAAHKYLKLKFTTGTPTAALSTYLGCFLAKFKKVLSPGGTVTASIYADNAGTLGTLLETSSTAPSCASMPSTGSGVSVQSTGFQWASHSKVSASTAYHLVFNFTGTIDGANYLTLVSNATVTSSNIAYSADGITWTEDATKSLWFQLDCGSFGCTLDATDNIVIAEPTASATTHGIMVGAVNVGEVARNFYTGPGIGHLFKNTNGASGYVYDLLAHCSAGSQSALYLKGALGMRVYHGTFMQTSPDSNLASAINIGSNSECGWNAPISDPELKNYIAVNTGIGAVFNVDTGGVPGITSDYGCIYAGPSSYGIERVAYPTWGGWQGAGKDAHSVNSNPLLASAPSNVIDFVPPSNSPAKNIGTNLSAIVANDFNGVAFSTTPTVGALNAG
ncbi:hypothetical protein [Caulobacter sp. CCG-8]|uniref:hypothetical protein n=1 Tax=Caulobacter sp. CCG-8 TaxID=3127958 RepID=UPI00307F04CD